jgi:hypothetical protein
MDNNFKFEPFVKMKATDDVIKKNVGEQIETNMVGFVFFVPGKCYYIVSGDGTVKYATKIISVTWDEEKGTSIIHEPFVPASGSNIYEDAIPRPVTDGRYRLR